MNVTKKLLPDNETMVANIVRVFGTATKQDVIDGTDWYEQAEEFARNLAAGTVFDTSTIAAVISAVSPRMPWGRNQYVAREIVRRYNDGGSFDGLGLSKNVNLAVDILDGADPNEVLRNKRLNFWRNIAGDPNSVTVDLWATRIAVSYEYDSPGTCYDAIANAYIEAAALLDVTPRALQAIVWVAYRRQSLTAKHLESLDHVREV